MHTHHDAGAHAHAACPAIEQKDDLLTPEEAAKELRVNPFTLKNWRSTGLYDLPFIKIGGRVFYRRSVIDDAKHNGLKKAGAAA
jgi:hypothetical protein